MNYFLKSKSEDFKPPQLKTNVKYSHRYRFISNSADVQNVTSKALIGACGVQADTTSTSHAIVQSIQVIAVSMWSPVPSQGSSTTCSVNFYGGDQAPNINYSDTSVSVTAPAVVHCRPPKNSSASFWQNQNVDVDLFNIIAPLGTIIDVTVNAVLSNNELGAGLAFAVSGATVGFMYFGGLDENVTGSNFPPVSLTSD
jgi:hypothetical protein